MDPLSETVVNKAVPAQNDQPVAVVRVLSVKGLEYFMMTFALLVGASSVAGILLSLVNNGTSFDVLAFPVSSLIVALGVFSFFFLRLKKAELLNPSLRFDPSKRRMSQITQIIAYLVSFFSVIGVVYTVLAKMAGSLGTPLWKVLLDLLIVLAVSGGILAYYWIDEHKVR